MKKKGNDRKQREIVRKETKIRIEGRLLVRLKNYKCRERERSERELERF